MFLLLNNPQFKKFVLSLHRIFRKLLGVDISIEKTFLSESLDNNLWTALHLQKTNLYLSSFLRIFMIDIKIINIYNFYCQFFFHPILCKNLLVKIKFSLKWKIDDQVLTWSSMNKWLYLVSFALEYVVITPLFLILAKSS